MVACNDASFTALLSCCCPYLLEVLWASRRESAEFSLFSETPPYCSCSGGEWTETSHHLLEPQDSELELQTWPPSRLSLSAPSEQAWLATLISFSKLPLPASDEKVYLGLEVLSFVFIATASGKVKTLIILGNIVTKIKNTPEYCLLLGPTFSG